MTSLQFNRLLLAVALVPPAVAGAQTPNGAPNPVHRLAATAAWQTCLGKADAARLTCFDDWARDQQKLNAAIVEKARSAAASPSHAEATNPQKALPGTEPAAAVATAQPETTEETRPGPTGIVGVGLQQGCRDRQFSEMSRFWELESGSSCPTFGLRAFHPNILSVVDASSVNRKPSSPNPINSATQPTGWSRQGARFVLSIRTKLASGLLTPEHGTRRDSLWLVYTQQSYWQVFNGALSRPFRDTDYMPELIYVYPTTLKLPGGWTWRYSGLGLVHQSNGQSDPLSRSWNRAYLMAGFEKGDRFNLQLRVWKRFPERFVKDNNPDIASKVGRGDATLAWNIDHKNTLRATYTGSFTRYGSTRLEWTHALSGGAGNRASGLRFYTGIFHGYGDSLMDYNYKRTVFSVGLSLVDF